MASGAPSSFAHFFLCCWVFLSILNGENCQFCQLQNFCKCFTNQKVTLCDNRIIFYIAECRVVRNIRKTSHGLSLCIFRPNTILRLRFNHFATECSWDHLYVYDGDSIYAPLLAAFRYVYCGLLLVWWSTHTECSSSLPGNWICSYSAFPSFPNAKLWFEDEHSSDNKILEFSIETVHKVIWFYCGGQNSGKT